MFKNPLPSSAINEFLVSHLSSLELFPLLNVKWKAVRIPIAIPSNGSFFVCPLVNSSIV
ncbi:hypothetical protein GHT06_020156 [Daphnia sinensis]|uniref:Uncharacterized protein n=1 Tax=Daphnia sinensis TaxID=1820382 RepID=A0AAD5PS29_9CRUS|nr:hypothetical protein GHT06_020156 [Daphnia sinensis]